MLSFRTGRNNVCSAVTALLARWWMLGSHNSRIGSQQEQLVEATVSGQQLLGARYWQ